MSDDDFFDDFSDQRIKLNSRLRNLCSNIRIQSLRSQNQDNETYKNMNEEIADNLFGVEIPLEMQAQLHMNPSLLRETGRQDADSEKIRKLQRDLLEINTQEMKALNALDDVSKDLVNRRAQLEKIQFMEHAKEFRDPFNEDQVFQDTQKLNIEDEITFRAANIKKNFMDSERPERAETQMYVQSQKPIVIETPHVQRNRTFEEKLKQIKMNTKTKEHIEDDEMDVIVGARTIGVKRGQELQLSDLNK
ncbi:Hypothetical_protein [Hexamita inflata]|uniref:Hypothetical_protein n=1 Tax=Hexamita inflata TaxID=28002 RepID=A0AA86UPG5_9EUKA|nr:Hypothetical protein HINF_LOCUS46951 [Hexamita inflata]